MFKKPSPVSKEKIGENQGGAQAMEENKEVEGSAKPPSPISAMEGKF